MCISFGEKINNSKNHLKNPMEHVFRYRFRPRFYFFCIISALLEGMGEKIELEEKHNVQWVSVISLVFFVFFFVFNS